MFKSSPVCAAPGPALLPKQREQLHSWLLEEPSMQTSDFSSSAAEPYWILRLPDLHCGFCPSHLLPCWGYEPGNLPWCWETWPLVKSWFVALRLSPPDPIFSRTLALGSLSLHLLNFWNAFTGSSVLRQLVPALKSWSWHLSYTLC